MSIAIRPVDPHDDSALRAWWDAGAAANADRPFDAWPTWEMSCTNHRTPRTDVTSTLVVAVDGERVVGAGQLTVFDTDNPRLAVVDVYVAPELRRRGIGRTVLADVEARAAAAGRSSLVASAFTPVGVASDGSLFASAMGYDVGSLEEGKTVDLTVAPATWDSLDVEVEQALRDYRVEVFEGHTPDRWVDDFCQLLEAFLTQIPLGDLDLEAARWSDQRLREGEERARLANRAQVVAVAVTPEGSLCGFSDLRLSRYQPTYGEVGGTLVLPEHRGHRLGLAMKLASHRRLLGLFPECAYIVTGNAGVNAHMNAVNQQLGYRVVERCLDVQKKL
ncbi:MAG: GNAT family N-acetyltransferase [Nocardioides sp.]|nr:GNAT family N-acetyltransferase [Nocardioides sp.]